MVKVAIPDQEQPEPTKKSKPVKKSLWFLKLTALLVTAAVAAPSAVSLTGSGQTVLKKLNPKLADAVSFGSVTLHWWAPVEITNLKILDLSQQLDRGTPRSEVPVLCDVERIKTAEPLWRIVLNTGRGTGISVKSPRLKLIADDQGTNLDRTITAIFGESKDTSGDRFPFRVTIEDGAVQLGSAPQISLMDPTLTSAVDAGAEKSNPSTATAVIAEVTNINGTFSTMDTARWLPLMKLSASISKAGGLQAASRTNRMNSRPARIAAGLDELANDFPDVPLEDLVGTDPSGDVNAARLQIYLQPRADDQGRQAIQIGARDVDLRLVQPFLSMLGINTTLNGVVTCGIDARLAGAEIKDGLVGRVMLAGEDVRIRQTDWAAEEWLPLGTVSATGGIAIAEDGMLIQNLDISTAVAEVNGNGEIRHGRSGAATGSPGQSQQVEINGAIDLAKVASSLRKTLALHDDVTIQDGKLTFKAIGSAASATATNGVASNSSNSAQLGSWQVVARADGLQAVRAGKPLRVDSNMNLELAGPFTNGVPDLAKARLTADFGTIDCIPADAGWKVSGLVQPASLWQTLQQFADVPQPGIRGDVNFQTLIAMQADAVQLTGLQLNSSEVRASSASLKIMPSNSVTSMLDGTVHVEGSGAALTTLMGPWFDASFLAEQSQVVADLTATPKREIRLAVRISPTNVATLQSGRVSSVSQSRLASAPASVFAVDEAEINLSMTTTDLGDQFEITNGTINIPGLSAVITGTVSAAESDTLVDLTADTGYDLDVLSRRVFAADSGLAFSGKGRDIFKLNGSPSALSGTVQPASSQTVASGTVHGLQGSGGIKWDSANLWGLNLGGAAIQATLDNNLVRTSPVECSLNGGTMNAMAQYNFASSRLQLGSGSRVENVKVTPELCREWLGYVAPMMADAADVNGQMSLRVERFLWDFNAVQNSDVAGQLTIHQAQATAGSSLAPMLEIVDLLQRRDPSNGLSSKSLTLPEQTIPVQVRQGYVTHDGLIMDLAGYRVKSSGAVGLNEQLQITLDVPLEKSSSGGNIRTVSIPLRGTIKHPQPDTAGLLQNLGTQQIQEKVGNEVDKALNKGLNKLLNR